MDKNTGEFRWINGTTPLPEDTTYSMPTFKVLGGQTLMVFGSSDGSVWAFQPRTGKAVWNYKMSRRGMSVSPLIVGETVYMAQNEENLDNHSIGMLSLSWRGQRQYHCQGDPLEAARREGRQKRPVMVGDKIYAADDRQQFLCRERQDGQAAFQEKAARRRNAGQPLGGRRQDLHLLDHRLSYLQASGQ